MPMLAGRLVSICLSGVLEIGSFWQYLSENALFVTILGGFFARSTDWFSEMIPVGYSKWLRVLSDRRFDRLVNRVRFGFPTCCLDVYPLSATQSFTNRSNLCNDFRCNWLSCQLIIKFWSKNSWICQWFFFIEFLFRPIGV